MKIGPLTLLCLILIALKLSGHIAWSWWWVMSPMWAPFLVVGVLATVVYWAEKK